MTEPSEPRPTPRLTEPDRSGDSGPSRLRGGGRPRRDLVTWVALGLLVAVALAIVSRTTTATPHDSQRTETKQSLHRSHKVESTRDPRTKEREPRTAIAQDHLHGSNWALTDPPATTSTTTTIVPPRTTTPTKPSPTRPTASDLLQYSGALTYPEDVATSIPFSSPNGVAAARITWSGGDELVASLRCRGAHDSAPGTHGISISIDGSPGGCVVAVALAPGVHAPVAYAITVLSPTGGG